MVDVKIDTPKKVSDNKGSCKIFVCNYMSKEDLLKGTDKEYWGNHLNQMISSFEVQQTIDGNQLGLHKNDAKFFTGSINLSDSELKHINNDPEKLKQYSLEFFKLYAENFNREITVNDLVYYNKVESNRYYKGDDALVKSGKVKQGDIKPGNNMHVHFIVSRMTKSGKKISPKTNHRHTDKGAVTSSFNRDVLFQKSEELFDRMFKYNRPLSESYKTFNSIKNGNPDERRFALQQNDKIELNQKIFLASSFEKRIQNFKSKIEQINIKLNEKNMDTINEWDFFEFKNSVLNGKTYFLLQNFEQRLDHWNQSTISNATEYIIEGIKNGEKSIIDQSGNMLQNIINSFTQIINQELTKNFALQSTDIVKDPTHLNYLLLKCLSQGAGEVNRYLLESIIGNDMGTKSEPNPRVRKNWQPLINEVNSTYTDKGKKPDQLLNASFVNALQNHYSEKEIKISLLLAKGVIKFNPDFHEIKNLNLLLFSILVNGNKKYNECPNLIKLERIRQYIKFLNSIIKGKVAVIIDADKVLSVEIKNNYSGKTLAYLNAINSKIKKEDFAGAEALIKLSPEEFIKTKSTNSNASGNNKSWVEKPDPLLRFGEVIESAVDSVFDILSVMANVQPNYASDSEEDDLEAKKKRRRRLLKKRRR